MSQSGGSSPTNASSNGGGAGNLRQIPIVCPGHSRPLAEVQYSPVTSDGFFLISACHDKLPMLRRGDTGDWIGTFEGHKGAVWSATIDSSAKYAATGSADFSVKFWNALTGDLITTFDHKHVVKSVEFVPNGSKLLTVGHEKLVRVFDLEPIKAAASAGKPIDSSLTAPIGQMNCKEQIRKVVAINNHIAVTGEVNGTISVWNLDTSELIKEFDVGVGIMDMESSRQGKVLTIASGTKVYFYDATNDFALIHAYEMPISFVEEGGASLHPTNDRFIAGGSDTWVRVFDFTTGELIETHKGHHGPVRCLRFSPDGNSFATGSEDGTIRLWQNDSSSSAAASISECVVESS